MPNDILPGQCGFWHQSEPAEQNIKNEYEQFLDKFERKKTTDDCFTPEPVYKAVLEWAVNEYGLQGREIVRPFWPDSDYKAYPYPQNCVVIDNPPFSIISEIEDFYLKRGVSFLLFAPALTLFTRTAASFIAVGANIEYANGAKVATSFATNLDGYKLRTAPSLFSLIERANKEMAAANKKPLSKYEYPNEAITAAKMQYFSKYGVDFKVREHDCLRVSKLDALSAIGKAPFGGCFLLSHRAAAERAAAERAAAERAAAERAAAERLTLSEAEKKIVNELGGCQ